ERLEAHVAGHRDLDHAAAGTRLDLLGLQGLLGLLLGGKHRLRLGEHLLKVGRLRHQVCSSGSGGSSSASNSSFNRFNKSSSSSVATDAAPGDSPSARSSNATRSENPVAARIAFAISSRFAGSSACFFMNVSDHATVRSSFVSADGAAPSSAAASIGWLARGSSITAGP